MTRGTLFYYESDDAVWSSTEYNGDMYHNDSAVGDRVIKLMSNLKNLYDFERVLKEINSHYKYEEGNKAYSINKHAIDNSIADTIIWIEKERTDLKNTDYDPRTWDKIPTFKDVTTWHFGGTPNLSDYSYIYNNSGNDLIMKTGGNNTITIPDGCLGVLNYGKNDCLCKDGRIIDGMGNYEEGIETVIKFIDYGTWEIGNYCIVGDSKCGYEVYKKSVADVLYSNTDLEECWIWIFDELKGGD
jgi:hypothetical protein